MSFQFKDFNSTHVHKSTLASLCATLYKVVDAFDWYDGEEKKIITDRVAIGNSQTAAILAEKLANLRVQLKDKWKPIFDEFTKKTRDRGTEIKDFESPLDFFTVISDLVKDLEDTTSGQEFHDQIETLKKTIENLEDKLSDKQEHIVDLQRSITKFEQNEQTYIKNSSYWQKEIERLQEIITNLEKISTKRDTNSQDDFGFARLNIAQRSDKAYKIDPKTPVFNSEIGENIKDWIFMVENALRLASVPEHLYLTAISNYVKGTAFQMLKADMRKPWKNFKEELLQTFLPPDHERRIRTKLLNLTQNESYDKYANDFQYWSNQISADKMSEEDRFACFMQGLRAKTRVELIIKGEKNLKEALLLAATIEHARTPFTTQHKANFIKLNNSVGRKGYRPAWAKNKHQYDNKKVITCYKCGKIGHVAPKCRVGNQSSVTKKPDPAKKNNPNQSNNNNIKCRKCGKMGHTVNSCKSIYKPKANTVANVVSLNMVTLEPGSASIVKNNDTVLANTLEELKDGSKILSINGTVEGKLVKCGLDSGCTNSIMSYDTVIKHNFNILQSDCKIKTADNSVSTVIGKTEPLELKVHNTYAVLSFMVIDHKDNDILLGLDWFAQTGAGIYPGAKTLKFPVSNIYLDEDIDSTEDTHNVYLTEVGDEVDIEGETNWTIDRDFNMVSESALDKHEEVMFRELVKDIKKGFAKNLNELGDCSIRKHKIRTLDEEPVYTVPYRKSESERLEIRKQIQEMLDAGIIRPSRSPWSSPIILVPKPNKTKRLCVDYRKLNEKTIQQNWPIPRILDILDRFKGSTIFSALDLKSGYWQVRMHEDSIAKTAFSTQDGHYEFLRLPFGLKNAPADFSRIMHMILGNLDFVEIYLDDITIHSKDFKTHVEHIKYVLNALNEANLKINLEKCKWCAREIKVLGHIVSCDKVEPDPMKVKDVQDGLRQKMSSNFNNF